MTATPHPPAAADLVEEPAPERGAANRGAPATVLPNGEVRGSGAGAGGGGGREDQDTDDPTLATQTPDAAEHHPEHHEDGRNYGSA